MGKLISTKRRDVFLKTGMIIMMTCFWWLVSKKEDIGQMTWDNFRDNPDHINSLDNGVELEKVLC